MENQTEITKGTPLKKSTKESLEESAKEEKQELDVILRLKQAILDYADIYDYAAEDITSTLCFFLGQLELSIAQRRQALINDNKGR